MYCLFSSILLGIISSTYVFSGLSDLSKISDSSLYFILAKSVIPGLIFKISLSESEYISTYFLTSGLGPTKLISPTNTLNNCGNSSNLVFLKNFPTFVILGSSPTVIAIPNFGASTTIVLNFKIVKSLLFFLTLFCLKNTGPFESNFIAMEIIIIGIAITKIPNKDAKISNNLLMKRLNLLFLRISSTRLSILFTTNYILVSFDYICYFII